MLFRFADNYTGQQGSGGRRFSPQSKALLLSLGYHCALVGKVSMSVVLPNSWTKSLPTAGMCMENAESYHASKNQI